MRGRRGALAVAARLAFLVLAGALGFKLGPRIYNHARLAELRGSRVYDETMDGAAELTATLERANREHKNVLVMLGGNWCQWCLALDDLLKADREIQALLHERYAVLKLDVDAAATLDASWGRPTRLGVPVLVFLDRSGAIVHVQETVSLEVWGGRLLLHDRDRVFQTLQKWAGGPAS